MFGRLFQRAERPIPIRLEIRAQLAEPVRRRAIQAPRAVSSLGHEAGLTEDPQVLRDRGAGDLEALGDGACRELGVPDEPKDLAAPWLGDRLQRVHRPMSPLTYVSVNLSIFARAGGATVHPVFDQADAYDRFMGRYSTQLTSQMADLARVSGDTRVLDVGCGPGALTGELVARVGAANVSAIDPSPPFVDAVRRRYPGVDARVASAEELPFTDDAFDASLAQLVVHFMRDPVAGLREMARVTKSGGAVVACVWDAAGQSPIAPFFRAARSLDSTVKDESERAGTREGHLAELFRAAGLRDVESTTVTAALEHPTFESWWDPFELGVGPAGAYLRGLDPARRVEVRERARAQFPDAPIVHRVRAWAARGTA